jgi:serine/threonine-protein kinase HipA
MSKAPRKLLVLANGEALGRLERMTNASLRFRYEESWVASHPNLPISRQLPVQEKAYSGGAVEAYFENLLPDNEEIRGKIAATFGMTEVSPFAILARLGKDCVGALQFVPEGEPVPVEGPPKGREIVESEIADLLRGLKSAPLVGEIADEDFRISIAGAQEKTALLHLDGKWRLPIGPTPTTHILKPRIGPTRKVDLSLSVENEWLCLKLCEAFGLPVARAEIENFEDQRTLVVERFDREILGPARKPTRIRRLLQEDFCQATGTPSHLKYENTAGSRRGPGITTILQILSESTRPETDRRTFLRAQIVFWLLAGTDGHAKNFSLHGKESGFYLTPIYDVLSADPFVAAGELQGPRLTLAMGVGRNRHYKLKEIMPRHWRESAVAAKVDPDEVDKIFADLLVRVPKGIDAIARSLPKDFPKSVSEPIFEGARKRLRILE